MPKAALLNRQVHIDFHTSPVCKNVGAAFDPNAFAKTIKQAHINSVTVFAKCHHGYSYYPTAVGTQHPNLSFDLLGAQIEALHRVGVRAPVYVSVMWDELAGQEHPEWIVADKDGKLVTRPPLSGEWGWTTMDVASGYGDYFMAQVAELCHNYTVDGFFFDICFPLPNYSPWGQAQMRRAGVNLEDDESVEQFARQKMLTFFEKVSGLIHSKIPTATIFYNSTVTRQMRQTLPYQTHFEVESLPTVGQWGYLHFPIMARQARTYGRDFLGMTGRFHGLWGDFGGLKTRDQLNYECGVIVSAGGKISVGDQLHPQGKLDPAVYRLIGQVFARIEALEPWLYKAQPVAEIAILTVGPTAQETLGIGEQPPDVEGAAQIFLETGRQFDIVDAEADLSGYQAVILPNQAALDEKLIAKLETYLAAGGKLILSGTAALDPTTRQFQLAAMPVTYLGPVPTQPSYLRPDEAMIGNSELAADYDYVFYDPAHQVQPATGATTYGDIKSALFNRTWSHFISHQHAPVGQSLAAPIAVRQDNLLYLAVPLFSGYRNYDYWVYRAMVQNLLADFLPPPLLKPTAPGWAEFTLHRQPANNHHPARQIVHITTYHPRRTLQPIQHVDQAGDTSGLKVAVKTHTPAQRVYLAPNKQPLTYTQQDDHLQIELPPVGPHTVVVIE